MSLLNKYKSLIELVGVNGHKKVFQLELNSCSEIIKLPNHLFLLLYKG